MNPVVLKGALKMLKNFISPDQMKQAAAGFLKQAIDFKRNVPLNNEAGEVDAVALIYEVSGTAYFSIAILNADNHILRFEHVLPLDDLIDSLISKI